MEKKKTWHGRAKYCTGRPKSQFLVVLAMSNTWHGSCQVLHWSCQVQHWSRQVPESAFEEFLKEARLCHPLARPCQVCRVKNQLQNHWNHPSLPFNLVLK